jgi:hypothetical protein
MQLSLWLSWYMLPLIGGVCLGGCLAIAVCGFMNALQKKY